MTRNGDVRVVRQLAARWRELADLPLMLERKRLWTALKDLKPERPMVLFETGSLEDYICDDELVCLDADLRGVERSLRWGIRHAEEVGDDLVLEPCWRVGWDIHDSGYGVISEMEVAEDVDGGKEGRRWTHPIQSPADLDRLKTRTWSVDRAATQASVDRLCDAFGDLLPVYAGGLYLRPELSAVAFGLVGNDNLLYWPYDEPEALHRLMAYLRDDCLARYRWLEAESLLEYNDNTSSFMGGSPGFISGMRPEAGSVTASKPRFRSLWSWVESQETTMYSPAMFAEFVLPYMAEVASLFGLVYYGCCEPVHDRWDAITAAIPQVRAVSISPWCDKQSIAGQAGRNVVFSRKPAAAPMSGDAPDWDALEKDVDSTLAAFDGLNLEFIFRDVYRIKGDRSRLRRWVQMVRSRIGGE